jgi:hypothetical protein
VQSADAEGNYDLNEIRFSDRDRAYRGHWLPIIEWRLWYVAILLAALGGKMIPSVLRRSIRPPRMANKNTVRWNFWSCQRRMSALK